MDGLELRDRKNVLNLYLNPAITEGYIRLLYPDSPRHPRQKYLLTVKGMALYNELKCCDSNSVKGRYAKNKYLYGFLGVPSLGSV